MKERQSYTLITLVISIGAFLCLANVNGKIDLNTATKEQLESIPGIGPSFAGKIVMERNRRGGFRSVNDLLKIRGIGRKTVARLKMYVKVVPNPTRDDTNLSRVNHPS